MNHEGADKAAPFLLEARTCAGVASVLYFLERVKKLQSRTKIYESRTAGREEKDR